MPTKLDTQHKLFSYVLSAEYGAEKKALKIIETLQERSIDPGVRSMFTEHAKTKREQITTLERCFTVLGQPPKAKPAPVLTGLRWQGKVLMRKTTGSLSDASALLVAMATESGEMAVYSWLIVQANALGYTEVRMNLENNRTRTQSAREKIVDLLDEVSVSPGVNEPAQTFSRSDQLKATGQNALGKVSSWSAQVTSRGKSGEETHEVSGHGAMCDKVVGSSKPHTQSTVETIDLSELRETAPRHVAP